MGQQGILLRDRDHHLTAQTDALYLASVGHVSHGVLRVSLDALGEYALRQRGVESLLEDSLGATILAWQQAELSQRSRLLLLEDLLGIDNLYESVNTPLIGFLNNAIKAKELFKRDKDYVNMDGEILIVDEVLAVGDAEFQDESSRELGKAFLLASILTFMVLAALLNSWYHPFTIGSSIITSFAGVFMFMFFASSSFNIASMLAMVMLVGLVVNNAILMLDATIRNLEAGMPVKDALWKGIEREFRAILMTSIAIVFGVFPQVFSNSGAKASMGVVLIGGMIASIFYTFVLTPVMFWYLERLRARINR